VKMLFGKAEVGLPGVLWTGIGWFAEAESFKNKLCPWVGATYEQVLLSGGFVLWVLLMPPRFKDLFVLLDIIIVFITVVKE
jgi:hypothetical protein